MINYNYAISERELEDYICESRVLEDYGIKLVGRQVSSFTVGGRQYDLGGVVDLIGYHPANNCWFIIELKKGAIDSKAYTQISRYIKNAAEADRDLFVSRCHRSKTYPHARGLRRIHGLLIGSEINGDVESFCDYISDLTDLIDRGSDTEREAYFFDDEINSIYVKDYRINVSLEV